MHLQELPTPALVVDEAALQRNIETMSVALPGSRLRPHVKAFKATALAARLADAGHRTFCAATIRELEGLAAAGLAEDLLLANEVLDCSRLGKLVDGGARITVAVDSADTVEAAAAGGVREVLVDVNVGLARCGCDAEDAGRLAEVARRHGLAVRGVMGYEGHLVGNPDRAARAEGMATATALLRRAHDLVGGDVVSGGGTGTYDLNELVTEVQAGSYLLMDTAYAELDLPFRQALVVIGTVVSVGTSRGRHYGVADVGLKALGMDHGNPVVTDAPSPPVMEAPWAQVWFCSDEHITFAPTEGGSVAVGDRVFVWPAHVDPTVAKHERLWLASGEVVTDSWPIDLRHW